MRFLLLRLCLCLLPASFALAEGPGVPDAEVTFRAIAIDQFSLTPAALQQKTVDISSELLKKQQFEVSDIPRLTYIALNFNTEEMAKLEPFYRKTLEYCAADSHLIDSCFLLDSAWQALSANSNEEFVKALEPYYQQLKDSSPKSFQLVMAIRWSTLMLSVKRYQKSLEMIHRGLTLVEQMQLDDVYRVILYNNLSLVYGSFGEFERAMEYVLKAIEIAKQRGFQQTTAHYYLNASNMISRQLHEHEEMAEEKKQELIQQLLSFLAMAEAIEVKAEERTFVMQQRAYAAFVEKKYPEARRAYQEVLRMGSDQETIAEMHFYLARIDLKEKTYERGLREVELGAKSMPADDNALRLVYLEMKSQLLRGLERYAEAVPVYADLLSLQQTMHREQLHSKFTQNLIDSSLQLKEDEARRMERELSHAARIKQLLILIFTFLLATLVLLVISFRQTRRLIRQNAYIIRQKDIIERQNQRMHLIFDNVQVGILEIDRSLVVSGEHSRAVGSILQRSGTIAGLSLKDLLAGRLHLDGDREAMFWAALDSMLGEDPNSWDFNHHHLIDEVRMGERLLRFQWQPIVSQGEVASLIILISDVTLQREMQRMQDANNEKAERQTHRIKELMLGSVQRALPLIRRLDSLLPHLEQASVLRDIHTLKGEARAAGLTALQEACHQFEGQRDGPAFVQVVREYQEIAGFWQGTDTLHAKQLGELALPYLEEARQQLQAAGLSWSGFEIIDQVGAWDALSAQQLPIMLLHGISNAVDHGFLRPLQRGQNLQTARLSLRSERLAEGYRLQLRDSGAGIDHARIQDLARQRDFQPAPGRPLSDILFAEGLSTAGPVSLTSGRGLGLSAVAAAAQALGGTAQLLDNDQGSGSLLEIQWPQTQHLKKPA